MDVSSFIASLIESLAWPFTIIFIVIKFRKSIGALLSDLTKFTWKDLSAEFGKKLRQAEVSARHALPPEPETPTRIETGTTIDPIAHLNYQIKKLMPINPAATISLAWSGVERKIRNLLLRIDKSSSDPSVLNFSKVLHLLTESGTISSGVVDVINTLQDIRNDIVHRQMSMPQLDRSVAEEYTNTAIALVRYFYSQGRDD